MRILLLPLPCALLFLEGTSAKLASLALGSLLGLTDYADGLLARKRKKTSALGALLDPVADKIFVSSVFLVFTHLGYVSYLLIFFLILREIIVAFFRSWFPEDLRVVGIARIKTFLQMLIAGMILILQTFFKEIIFLSNYLILVVIFLSYFSALPYFYRLGKKLLHRNLYLKGFSQSLLELVYPLSILLTFPQSGKLFFSPIIALALYFFRSGLSKSYPFRSVKDKGLLLLASLALLFENLFFGSLFYSLFFLLLVSLYVDGWKSLRLIWGILKLK